MGSRNRQLRLSTSKTPFRALHPGSRGSITATKYAQPRVLGAMKQVGPSPEVYRSQAEGLQSLEGPETPELSAVGVHKSTRVVTVA